MGNRESGMGMRSEFLIPNSQFPIPNRPWQSLRSPHLTTPKILSVPLVLTFDRSSAHTPIERLYVSPCALGPAMVAPTNLLQGTLDLLILKALSLGELHGLGVTRRVEQITKG